MLTLKTVSCHTKKTELPIRFITQSLRLPKGLLLPRDDKHSDLTLTYWLGDTVMAVATDSHRDFLTPEHTVLQYARQPTKFAVMNRVYSFVGLL